MWEIIKGFPNSLQSRQTKRFLLLLAKGIIVQYLHTWTDSNYKKKASIKTPRRWKKKNKRQKKHAQWIKKKKPNRMVLLNCIYLTKEKKRKNAVNSNDFNARLHAAHADSINTAYVSWHEHLMRLVHTILFFSSYSSLV